jgi:hypothetical protein
MISETRQALYDHLVPLAQPPSGPSVSEALALRRWLPEDVTELPCAVVGRPTAVRSREAAAIFDLLTPVYVIGRRLNDDDAQAELDIYTDLVFGRLTQPISGLAGRTELRLDPSTVQIAEQTYPDYIITVTTSSPLACP